MYSLHKQLFSIYCIPGSGDKKKTETKPLPLIGDLAVYSAKKSGSREEYWEGWENEFSISGLFLNWLYPCSLLGS